MSIIRNGFQDVDLDVPVVLPTLNLDFANSQELDPRITFSRGSIGTFVNKNGLIETAAANTPRFDYDPISGECKGLLIEESRVNYFWGTQTGNGGSVTDGTVTGANGVTAKKFVPNLGNASFPSLFSYTSYVIPVGSQVAGGTVDVSFSGYFASVADGLYLPDIVIQIDTAGTNQLYAELMPNLSNGTVWTKALNTGVGWSELIAPQITLIPFGMYKVTWSIRYTQGATIRDTVRFYIQCRRKGSTLGSNTGTYYADGVNGFQFSCIQYEIGAFPTSYIPTTTSSVTRSADNVSMIGSNFTSVFGSGTPSELSVFYSGLAPYVSNNGGYYWLLTNASTTERIQYRYAGQPQVLVYLNNNSAGYGGVYVNATQDRNIRSVGLIDNKSIAIRSSDSPTSVSSANLNIPRIPTGFTQLNIGSSPFGSNYLNGTIRKLAFYPKRLTNSQAVYLTQ